jgi:hypothetical protein
LVEAIAFDITRLREWIGKSKSSLNGSLKMLGYGMAKVADCSNIVDELLTKIPNLQTDGRQRLRWTIGPIPQLSRPQKDPIGQYDGVFHIDNEWMNFDIDPSDDDDIDGSTIWTSECSLMHSIAAFLRMTAPFDVETSGEICSDFRH